ncbi:MAG: hypothetical protein QOH27_5145 [Mycobacterium sp.]|jgi:hypothetical protein|nr:hypothetical protein [Mycobacterium sp.]
MTPDVEYLADHTLLLAIPAFFPAVVVVGVVVFVAMRDRRKPDDDSHDEAPVEQSAPADDDGSP